MWLEITRGKVELRKDEGAPSYQQIEAFFAPDPFTVVTLYSYQREEREIIALVSDEGLIHEHPQSIIIPGLYPDGSGVRGPVMLVATNMENGETEGLRPDELDKIKITRPNDPLVAIVFGGEETTIAVGPWLPTLRMIRPE
jgi:hypothetical protein